MQCYDLLLTPTIPVPAYPVGRAPKQIDRCAVRELFWRYFGFNTTGQPAMTVPCGFTGSRLLIGLQISDRG